MEHLVKQCSQCCALLPVEQFYKRKSGSLYGSCKACYYTKNKKWKLANTEKYLRISKHHHYLNKYGLSIEQVEAMKDSRSHCCDICLDTYKLCVDHCHITGIIRGILCDSCNVGIARFKDSTINLSNAIDYLNRK